jgi:hypothetical protein
LAVRLVVSLVVGVTVYTHWRPQRVLGLLAALLAAGLGVSVNSLFEFYPGGIWVRCSLLVNVAILLFGIVALLTRSELSEWVFLVGILLSVPLTVLVVFPYRTPIR